MAAVDRLCAAGGPGAASQRGGAAGGAAQTANDSGLTPAPADALGALAQQPPIDAAAADALQAQQARSTEGSGAMPIIILALAIL